MDEIDDVEAVVLHVIVVLPEFHQAVARSQDGRQFAIPRILKAKAQ